MSSPEGARQKDKATEAYWSNVWERGGVPQYKPIERRTRHDRLDLHPFFRRHLGSKRGASIIEVGCGSSTWLPYFAREFGLEISGLDYSPAGCRSSRAVLENAGVDGEIHLADVFSPPDALLGTYDFAVSLGVIEHFENTSGIVGAIARLVKPGGLVLTTLPNLSGWMGTAQKILDKSVYDVHVPLSAEDVREGHIKAGLNVIECEYVCPLDFHVSISEGTAKAVVHKALMRFTRTVWAAERFTGQLTPNQRTATYILCAARVPI